MELFFRNVWSISRPYLLTFCGSFKQIDCLDINSMLLLVRPLFFFGKNLSAFHLIIVGKSL